MCEITEVLFPSKQYKNCSFGVTLSDSDTEYVFSAEVLIRPLMQVFPKCCAFMWWGGLHALMILEAIPAETLVPGGFNHAEHLKLKTDWTAKVYEFICPIFRLDKTSLHHGWKS